MMIKKLKPMYDVKKLIRVGSFSDGGYVMPKKIYSYSKLNIHSLGVGFEYTFEKDIIKNSKNSMIYLYDHSCGFPSVFHDIKKNILKLNIINALKCIYRFVKFNIFLIRYKKIVNFESFFITDRESKNEKTFLYALNKINESTDHNLNVLKIDIERGEYLILNEENISSLSKKTDIVVLEIHGLITHHERIEKILEMFKFEGFFVGHFHNNNYTPYHKEFGMNNCFEVTLLHERKFNLTEQQNITYPLEGLDVSCCSNKDEISFKF